MNSFRDPQDFDHGRHEPADWSVTEAEQVASDYYAVRCEHCIVGGANDYQRGLPTETSVGDCPACGENICADCIDHECGIRTECSCGRIIVGAAIHWVDCNPKCDKCDPMVACEECSTRVRKHEISDCQHRSSGDWYAICPDCRGDELCEDCAREDAKEVKNG